MVSDLRGTIREFPEDTCKLRQEGMMSSSDRVSGLPLWNRRRVDLLALGLYIGVTILITFPTILQLGTSIYR